MGAGVLKGPFAREGGVLRCGSFSLDELASRFGTPLYVYALGFVEERFRTFERVFAALRPLIAYSVKANANLALLHRLGRLGAGADIVGLGELVRARRAGIPGNRIVFSGVAKTEEEMEVGLREGILAFNVESAAELQRLEDVAARAGVTAPFAVRLNPDVHASTPHEYTRTGHGSTKFGVPVSEACDLYRWAGERPHLKAVGIDVHIGSQIAEVAPYTEALERALDVVDALPDGGPLSFVDLGGGYAVGYERGGPALDLAALAAEVERQLRGRSLRLVVEPGRALVGEAGLLLTRVQYVKTTPHKTFVIVDGGMTDLIRPSHYGGYHGIEPVVERLGAPTVTADVVGPICEAGDFLARERVLPRPEAGDVLAVMTAGAYGFTMASNYNARRRPAEVLVDGDRVHVVRARETVEDLMRGEIIPWAVGDAEGAHGT